MPGLAIRTRENKTVAAAKPATKARSGHKVSRGAVERPSAADRKEKRKRARAKDKAEYKAAKNDPKTIAEFKQVIMLTCSEAIKDELRRTQTNDPKKLLAYLMCPVGGMGTQNHGGKSEDGQKR